MHPIYPPLSRGDTAKASTHAHIVAQHLPDWLVQAAPAMRQALTASQNESHAAKQALKPVVDTVRGVVELCDEWLKRHISERFGVNIEPQQHSLVRAMRNSGMGFSHVLPVEQNLLVAAMQNFAPGLQFPRGSMVLPVRGYKMVTRANSIWFEAHPHTPPVAIDPKQFADACRELDLGKRYQQHLDSVFKPAQHPEVVTALFKRNDLAHFNVLAHLARLCGHIQEDSYRMLLQIGAEQAPVWSGAGVRYHWLRMFASADVRPVSLYGVQLIEHAGSGRCIVFMPGEPEHPLKEYSSFAEFAQALYGKLKQADYAAFVAGLVGERDRGRFLQQLSLRLAGSADGWTKHANLEKKLFVGNLFELQHTDRLAKLYDDARVTAVPTADEDAIALEQTRQRYLGAGLLLLNMASLLVPVLGAAMMVCAAAQLLREVFTGVDDWKHGDDHDAFTHAMGVAENLVQMAAFAGAVKVGAAWLAPKAPALTLGSQLDDLLPVFSHDGRQQLWRPALNEYAAGSPLPAGLEPDEEAIYSQDERDSVYIDDRLHDIRYDDQLAHWRVVHPDDGAAYQPLIERVGDRWQLADEQQIEPQGHVLRDRLGHTVQALSADDLKHALDSVGVDARALEEAFQSSDQPSALLTDALQRFVLRREVEAQAAAGQGLTPEAAATRFKALYDAKQFGHGAEVTLLIRDFPSLSVAVAEEVLLPLAPGERAAMLKTDRVPLTTAERARRYQQGQRLNRALEGLVFSHVQSADVATLRTSIKLLLREPGSTAAEPSASAIRDYALAHREQCARMLGQRPPQAGLRAPMRDAQGRIGYPLSGRGRAVASREMLIARIRHIYPGTSRAVAIELLGSYEAAGMSASQIQWGLNNLANERVQLRAQMANWAMQRPSNALLARFLGSAQDIPQLRRDVGTRMDIAWRRQIPSEAVGQMVNYYLNLVRLPLIDFPLLSADLRYVSHLNLTGSLLDAASLTRLLAPFSHLRRLSLRECHMGTLPAAVDRLTLLTELDLSSNELMVNQALMDRLGRLPNLTVLSLNSNSLGNISAINGFARLQELNLAGVAMTQWPQWLGRLPALRTLNLYRTRLAQIPESVFTEAGQGSEVSVYLERESLNSVTVRRLDQAQGARRRFGFYTHSAPTPRPATPSRPRVDDWLIDTDSAHLPARRALWVALEDDRLAAPLLRLIDSLRDSPDYTGYAGDLRERVWRVLTAAGRSTALRERFYDMAAQLDTCIDGERLLFSDMEVLVLQEGVLQGATAAERGVRLFGLAQGLFRIDQLEVISRRLIADRRNLGVAVDEAEVRMAMRTYLATRLQLPGQPNSMAYPATAGITVDISDDAEREVLTTQEGTGFLDYMVRLNVWSDYLREQYATEFEQRLAPFATQMTTLDESLETMDSAEYLRRANAIAAQREAEENTLLRELTQREQVGFQSAAPSGGGTAR